MKQLVIQLVLVALPFKAEFQSSAPPILTSSTTYDFAGRVTSTADATGKITAYDYDSAGRRWRVRAFVNASLGDMADTVTTISEFDVNGNLAWTLDPNQHALIA